MRINFRQGIVSHQAGGFLSINPSGNVDLLASNRPTTVTIAPGPRTIPFRAHGWGRLMP